MILTSIVLIVKGCYEYWILFDDALVSKKIFCKRTEIKLTEIQKVEKKIVPALVLGIYKSEAYIIYSKNEKIIILIDNKKNYSDLNFELTKFINIARKEGKYYNG
jgi:hypothetical protein